MTEQPFRQPVDAPAYSATEMKKRATEFYAEMKRRRTIRDFSDRSVTRAIIEDCLRTAGTAPSGANQQPWTFVAVSDPKVKAQIRQAAEAIEWEFYRKQATAKWRKALKPVGTTPSKAFLETASHLIAIFVQQYSISENGDRIQHYYASRSVGIATGMLITALHHAGLATLPYTPADMRFLNEILARPTNERPFMILVVGYPHEDARVPVIGKKSLEDISVFV